MNFNAINILSNLYTSFILTVSSFFEPQLPNINNVIYDSAFLKRSLSNLYSK